MQSYTKAGKIATAAVLTALALILSYIEFLIPVPIGIPGIKLGLANIVIVMCLYRLGGSSAFLMNLARVCLAALLFGSMFSALYSFAGACLSIAIMLLLKKTSIFSVVGVSMAGGVFHNIGQLITAAAVVQTKEVYLYLPVLLIAGMLTGIINGILSTIILRSLK